MTRRGRIAVAPGCFEGRSAYLNSPSLFRAEDGDSPSIRDMLRRLMQTAACKLGGLDGTIPRRLPDLLRVDPQHGYAFAGERIPPSNYCAGPAKSAGFSCV